MLISIIAAMARNGVIGRDGRLPWRLPADLRRFRELTTGHAVIMGRKTYESIGRPLPDRVNIVITGQPNGLADGVLNAGSLAMALEMSGGEDEVFIAGGGEIYTQALPFADRLYLTVLDADFNGDTLFPPIPLQEFRELYRKLFADDPGGVFLCLERIVPPRSSAGGEPA